MRKNHGDILAGQADRSSSDPPVLRTVPRMFGNLSTRPYVSTSERYKVGNRCVARFIIKDLMPMSTVEGEGFKELLSYFDPRYILPCRKTIHETEIMPLYDITKSAVQAKLSNMAERICFTSDGWSSIAEDRYVSLTAHYINKETFELENYLLACKEVQGSHTGVNLMRELEHMLMDWEVLYYNASNILCAMRVGKYDHVGCLAHTIHSAVGAGLDTTDASELLVRCKKIVSQSKHSPLEYEKLKHELDNDQFIQSIITRWDSTYDMLSRVHILMPSICKVLSLPENRKYQCLLLTHEEI